MGWMEFPNTIKILPTDARHFSAAALRLGQKGAEELQTMDSSLQGRTGSQ